MFAVIFAVWGAWVFVAQAQGQYLTTEAPLTVGQLLERNIWPIFTAIIAGLGAYWRMSIRQDVTERDIKALQVTKADANLVHEQIGAIKEGMSALREEVVGLRQDLTTGLTAALAEAINRSKR